MKQLTSGDGGQVIELDQPQAQIQIATKVAELCSEIIEESSITIGEGKKARKYLKCEGWQAIANSFGMVGSARDVEKVYDPADDRLLGFKATGEVRRMRDNQLIATGEGFVGVDEIKWFGGLGEVWDKQKRKYVKKEYKPAAEYAVRSMAQTRAISKACRGAFAFVLILMNKKHRKNYSTTPAEEMATSEEDEQHGGGRERPFDETAAREQVEREGRKGPGKSADWRDYVCTYGTKDGPLRNRQLGELTDANLRMLYAKFVENPKAEISPGDKDMVVGLKLWHGSQQSD